MQKYENEKEIVIIPVNTMLKVLNHDGKLLKMLEVKCIVNHKHWNSCPWCDKIAVEDQCRWLIILLSVQI